MTVLRSREIVMDLKPRTPPKISKIGVIGPSTPAKSQESNIQISCNISPSSSSLPQVPEPARFASDMGTTLRRSLRLSSNSSTGGSKVILPRSSRKRRSNGIKAERDCILGSNKENVVRDSVDDIENQVSDVGVRKVRVSGRIIRTCLENEGTELGLNEVSERGEAKVLQPADKYNSSSDLGSLGHTRLRKEKGRREFKGDTGSWDMDTVGEKKPELVLNLRSGRVIVKRMGRKTVCGDGGEADSDDDARSIRENKSCDKSNEQVEEQSGKGLQTNNFEVDPKVDETGIPLGRMRFSREEKGKGKLVDEDLIRNGSDPGKLDSVSINDNSLDTISHVSHSLESVDENDDCVRARKRLRQVGNRIAKAVRTNLLHDQSLSGTADLVDNAVVQNFDPIGETTASADAVSRGYEERFKDIARKNASRFAHFSSTVEVNGVADDVEREIPYVEVVRRVEDWPGPFSTAMKIIKDRGVKANVERHNSSLEKSQHAPVLWIPKADGQRDCSKNLVPSLQELCMKILTRNAEAITSLDCVPDVLRNKLSQLLCDSRRMGIHFFNLLVRGSPTEVRVRDCSWLTEEQFTMAIQGCDLKDLMVLQLDQCGRCMTDYILFDISAQLSNGLPALTAISFKGACRLSDIGLNTLASLAPALRSINVSQCSLVSSDGIKKLADSMRSVLRELYLDDCQNIDAMVILPALVKLEHLELLSLAGVPSVSDDFVSDFVAVRGYNMKELVLADCVRLTDASLKVIADSCSQLCGIDVSNLRKLTDSSIGYLANGCPAIQTLKLGCNAFRDEAIAAYIETRGGSLKELSLNNVKKVAHNTAISLARHSRYLLSLDLSWCRNLTNEALGLIVDNCSSLKLLKLFGCTQVTNVFLQGYSNPHVKIVGLKMTPLLEQPT